MRYEVHDEDRLICRGMWPERCHMERSRLRGESWRVLLVLDKEEVLADVGDDALVQGDTAIESESTTKAALHNWMEVTEEDNEPRVTRIMRLAVSEIERMLYKLTRTLVYKNTSIDDTTLKKTEFLIELRVSVNASESSVTHLLNLSHEYMVAKVLEDWSVKTAPAFKDFWAEKVATLAEQITSAGNLCENHKVRRKMWPAW